MNDEDMDKIDKLVLNIDDMADQIGLHQAMYETFNCIKEMMRNVAEIMRIIKNNVA